MNSIETFFSGNIAYAFAWTMIHSLWQCSLVAAALGISLRITRNHSASLRYLQGLFALFICVMISGITFFRFYNNITGAEQILQTFGAGLSISYIGSLWEQVYVKLNNVIHYIVLLWVFGFAVQFYRYSNDFVRALSLGGNGCENVSHDWTIRFNRLAQHLNLIKKFNVKISCRVTSICHIGHFKPVILLPIGLLTSLPIDQVEALILHELAHIKRNDYLVNIMQCFVRLFYFFNPAVLWISSRIDLERENACDDVAVKHCGNPSLYADSLANISELELNMITVLAAKKSNYQILSRIKRLFSNSSSISKSMEQLISAICACFVVAAMNVSAAEINFPKLDNSQSFSASVALTEKPETLLKSAEQSVSQPETSVLSTIHPQNETTPVAALKASPELDYATTLLAMNEVEAVTPAKPAAERMQLASATEEPQGQTKSEPKLEPLENSDFDSLLISNNFKLPLTRKIYIADAQVNFSEDWLKRFRNAVPSNYQEIIAEDYGQSLSNNLKKALVAAGWQILESPGDDAVRLSPRLFDLFINAPEPTGVSHTLVQKVGHTSIELVFETPDSQPFMKIIDSRNTQNQNAVWANRATNYRYFDKLVVKWSEGSVVYLERLMSFAEKQK
ncbi:MAG: M56 family metallopeptidase [Gammaproteobacteria bacterium]|nr:M56 family metallopeptidase [Gammaproteobacteria bacterium]